MSRAVSIIQEFPSNKEGIKLMAEAIVVGVMSGDVNPLDVRAKIDAIEKIIKAVKDDQAFKDAALDQADLYPEKTFDLNGVKFTKAVTAKYEYTGDEIWVHLKDKEVKAAAARKEREEILKALKAPTEIEGVICHPPVKRSSEYIRITF